MGNADLIVSINGNLFFIDGSKYNKIEDAIVTAMKKFTERNLADYKGVTEADQKDLNDPKELMLQTIENNGIIQKIELKDVIAI